MQSNKNIKNNKVKSICIIGLGQIGGSVATKLIKKNYHIIGISRKESTIKKAMEKKIINEGYTELKKEILDKSDLVIIATHLGLYDKFLSYLHKIKYSGIVSDVGSVKKPFYSMCKKYKLRFAGAHPIAGTEKSGIESINPHLFENKFCIISGWSDERSKRIVSQIWKEIGSKIVLMSPDEHDRLLSFISHLPHVIAFSAVKTAEGMKRKHGKKGANIAGGSLKDITRVVKSPTEMWVDIFVQNSENISVAVKMFQKEISKLLKFILLKDKEKIKNYIEEAKKLAPK